MQRFATVFALILIFSFSVQSIEAAGCLQPGRGMDLCDLTPLPEDEVPPYVEPDSAEDTLFGKRWYGRIADFAEVYPEPTRASTPVRNAGDGYVFASIITQLTDDAGDVWYRINYDEYVHEDDLTVSKVSEFRGVELTQSLQNPFAWVVQEIRPSSKPDGEPSSKFDRLERYDIVEILDAVIGEDEWIWYNIGDGRWVRQTQFSVVTATPRPEEVGPKEFWTEVDLFEQTLKAYEGDQLVFATLISSGLNQWPTVEGIYQVVDRLKEYKMSGSQGFPDYYHLEDIPYIMYFNMDRGIALHGTYWHDSFGYKQSHGCVNLAVQDAEWTYTWSDTAPNDLWVYVHTTDPLDQFETE